MVAHMLALGVAHKLIESAGNAGHLEGPQVRAKGMVDGGVSVGFFVLALLQ